MAAKARVDRSAAPEPVVAEGSAPDAEPRKAGFQSPPVAIEAPEVGELEGDVRAVALAFDAMPPPWRRYFDREARQGQEAYGRA